MVSGPPLPSMERAIHEMFGSPGDETAEQRAQALVYDAWETPDRAQRIALARAALELSPRCTDALTILADEASSTAEAAVMFAKAVELAAEDLGASAFEEDVGHFWGIFETRPYMRARQRLAQSLWALGQRDEAIGHYRDMLRLNPGDNQGIRYLLAACLLDTGRDADLAKLLSDYGDEGTAAWAYTAALLAFRAHGPGPEANRRLSAAKEANPHVPAYLLGKKKVPRQLPGYIGFGDESEAMVYAGDFGEGWRKTPGSLEWLRQG